MTPGEESWLWNRPEVYWQGSFSSDLRWVFRGQADSNWGLQPKVFRMTKHLHDGQEVEIAEIMRWAPGQVRSLVPPPNDLARRELSLVYRYCRNLEKMGIEVPHDRPDMWNVSARATHPRGFPPKRWRAAFALAQHYGIPTRLLDWSTDALVAAYFAAVEVARERWEGNRERECLAVWALYVDSQRWFDARGTGFEFVTAPTASNPNLFAQSGLFTLVRFGRGDPRAAIDHPPDLDSFMLNSALPELGEGARLRVPALVKLTLPCSQARALLMLLELRGISAAKIYPGHRGAAEALSERRWMQWSSESGRS